MCMCVYVCVCVCVPVSPCLRTCARSSLTDRLQRSELNADGTIGTLQETNALSHSLAPGANAKEICAACVQKLDGDVLTTTSTVALNVGDRFTVGTSTCVYRVDTVNVASVDLETGHGCTEFSGQALPLKLYTKRAYVIENLTPGHKMHVRVSAQNAQGNGPPSYATASA